MSETEPLTIDPLPDRGKHDAWVTILTVIVGSCIVAYLTWYNRRTWIGDEYLVVNSTYLLFVPVLLIIGGFRESLESFGFARPEKNSVKLTWKFFFAMLPILIIASRFKAFQDTYPLRPVAAVDGSQLLLWELSYGMYMFSWEFFYRGFLTFGVSRKLGWWPAIIIQAAAFGMMHYGKPPAEFISSFFGGAILGWLALKSKSFLPCFSIHWAISVLMDLLSIHGKPGALF